MDMVFLMSETADGLVGQKHYNSELYSVTTIRGLLQFYNALLTVLATDPEILDAPRQQLIAAAEWKALEALQRPLLPLQLTGAPYRQGHQVVDTSAS